ncbi:hypothetical protein BASA81_018055 [Batrachochytrium salamandrivorans]|nr:hypothetical protein BASA62_003306 [Batrachochytrium salamandrivorans]KAH9244537.1 hypothetical protein BASA81_018055 [Batrachochytrium salamandrivorans]
MKLSSFFVAVMVITSVNAGWPDKPEGGDTNTHVTGPSLEPSLPSVSNSMSAVKKQMDNSPILKHMLNGEKEHDDLLMGMFNIKEIIFDLMNQIEHESSKRLVPYESDHSLEQTELNHSLEQAELIEIISSGLPDYYKVTELLREIDENLKEFFDIETKYVTGYGFPTNTAFLSSDDLNLIPKLIRFDLDLLK